MEPTKIPKSLTQLPPELIASIIALLLIPELLVLSRVNRALNELAEEMLYRNIKLIWKRKRRARTDAKRRPQFLNLHTVLFGILRVNRRAAYVQHLHIDTHDLLGIWGRSGARPTEIEMELAECALVQENIRLDERKQWLANLANGVPNAYIALLLLQVRNIRSLDLGPTSINSGRSLGGWWDNSPRPIEEDSLLDLSVAALRQKRIPDTGFTHLQKFQYSVLEDYPGSSIYALPTEIEKDHILPFFRGPNISSMSLYLFSTQKIFVASPIVSTTITELVLERYNLGLTQLERLVQMTPKLRILKLDYWVNCDSVANSYKPHMDIGGLFYIISSFRGSLQELQLSTRFWRSTADYAICYDGIKEHGGDYDDPTTHWGLKGSMPSLKDFKQLKILALPSTVLLGWNRVTAAPNIAERLPCTLSRLVLRDDLWEWARYSWSPDILWRELQMSIRAEGYSVAFSVLHEVFVMVSFNKMEDLNIRTIVKGLKAPFKHGDTTLNTVMYEDEFTPSTDCTFPVPMSPSEWDFDDLDNNSS